MKIFIALALFAATATASLIHSPLVGYSTYGLSAGTPLLSSVRAYRPISTSYVSPIVNRVVSPISTVAVRTYQPVVSSLVAPVATRLVSSPVVTGVRTISHLSSVPVATRIVSPVSSYSLHSAPLVSNIVAPSLYSNHGAGIHATGYLTKKL